MAQVNRVTGLKTVLANLSRSRQTYEDRIPLGLLAGGLFLFGRSQEIVPVEFGNLKGSGFVRSSGSGIRTVVTVGYTAAYAVYVHENLDALHGESFNIAYSDRIAAHAKVSKKGVTTWPGKTKWFPRGPNQQAKFLEKPMREERRPMIQLVVNKVKGR